MDFLNKDYYTVKEVAEICNVTIETVSNKIYVTGENRYKIKVRKINGNRYISKEEVIKYQHYLDKRFKTIEIDTEYAINSIKVGTKQYNFFPETRKLFLDYSLGYFNKSTGSNNYKNSTIGQFINFHNKIQSNLTKEIFNSDIDRLNLLFLKEDLFGAKEKLLFTRFLTFVLNQKKVPQKNKILANPKSRRNEQEIYSALTFNQIYKHVQRIDLHVNKSLHNRQYANMWLYVTLLCCDFIRGSDLILNTPNINLKDHNIKETDFRIDSLKLSEYQIQTIIKAVYLAFRGKRASKTGEILTFLVPSNLEAALAYSLVLSEHLRDPNTLQLETFIEGKYRRIDTQGRSAHHLRFFKDYKEFTGFRFSSLIMNRSLATYLYGSVTEGDGYDSELALTLAKEARSHKNDESTKAYIQMMNRDGSLGNVSLNIFRRGNFGWLYDQLLRFTFSDKYLSLSLVDRTTVVEEIKDQFSPKDFESLAAYISNYLDISNFVAEEEYTPNDILNSIYKKRLKIIHQIMHLKPQQLHELFINLSNDSMPSKNEHAQCLVFPNCAYPTLSNCMYCEYVLPQNLILIQLNQEILRLLTSIQESNNENYLKKQSRFLLQCLLILSEANNAFGKDYVKAYVDIAHINSLLKTYAYKISITGDNYGN